MSMQSTDSDTENPSDEQPSDEHSSPGSAYGELLGVSSLEELQEKPWEVKLALLQHHLELAESSLASFWRRRSNRRLESDIATTIGNTAGGEPIPEASGSARRKSPSRCLG